MALTPCEPPWCNRRIKFDVKIKGDTLKLCGHHTGEALKAKKVDKVADRIVESNRKRAR